MSSTAGGRNIQICRISSRNHTWRFLDLDAGATWCRAPKKEVLPQRDAPGGAVTRSMSSENQVWVNQDGATGRTCSSSSLTLHSVCVRKLTGGNAYLRRAQGQLCASGSMPRGPRSGSHTTGHGRTRGRQPGLLELSRIDSRTAGSSRDGIAILRER